MEKRIKYGTALLFFLITGLGLYGYFTHLSRDPSGMIRHADIQVTADALSTIAEKNETAFDSKYLYKTLSVRGIVRKIRKNSDGYILHLGNTPSSSFMVRCIMDSIYSNSPPPVNTGDSCVIRGTCAGHLKEVVLLSGIIEK